MSLKPENLSDVDASAVLYAGLTAWSGLYITGQLGGFMGAITSSGGGKDKKVLVLGASGGVGSMAVQMLLAEDAHVTVTCSSDAFALMQNLGVHKIIDYSSENSDTELIMESPYDIILDCAGKGPEYAATLPWTFKNYVTFNSPLLKNFDDHGLITGGLKNAKDLVSSQISALNSNGLVKWGYFVPAPNGIKYLKKLCESRKVISIFCFKLNTIIHLFTAPANHRFYF